MSIEQNLAALTAAVVELTAALKASGTANVPQAAAPVAPVMQYAPNPAPAASATFAPPVAAAPAMPAPPMFAPPAPAPVAPAPTGAPFTDTAGLIAYVMAAYKEMGPQKGANIQGVLTSLGYQNINDVKPEHYAGLYQGVEALKRG